MAERVLLDRSDEGGVSQMKKNLLLAEIRRLFGGTKPGEQGSLVTPTEDQLNETLATAKPASPEELDEQSETTTPPAEPAHKRQERDQGGAETTTVVKEHESESYVETDVHDNGLQISPLKRCLEALKMSREIGLPEAMWLPRRAINGYVDSTGSNYAAKMQRLEALRTLWARCPNAGDPDPIRDYMDSIEHELRGKAEGVQ